MPLCALLRAVFGSPLAGHGAKLNPHLAAATLHNHVERHLGHVKVVGARTRSSHAAVESLSGSRVQDTFPPHTYILLLQLLLNGALL